MTNRSEIKDVMPETMAQCLVINKGDHTIEILQTLRDILQRTGGYHVKKGYIFAR